MEPVFNANDGFHLLAAGVPTSGVVVLKPQETLALRFALHAEQR